jgi:hypothetical protein
MKLIWVKREAENFLKEGWTGGFQNCLSGKSTRSHKKPGSRGAQLRKTYCAG